MDFDDQRNGKASVPGKEDEWGGKGKVSVPGKEDEWESVCPDNYRR